MATWLEGKMLEAEFSYASNVSLLTLVPRTLVLLVGEEHKLIPKGLTGVLQVTTSIKQRFGSII